MTPKVAAERKLLGQAGAAEQAPRLKGRRPPSKARHFSIPACLLALLRV